MIVEKTLDSIASNYKASGGFERVITRYKTKIILKLCKGDSALDLGCGIGMITKELSGIFKRVVAVDGSAKKIQIAKSRVKENNVVFENKLFEDFEPNIKFDTIIVSNVLEHVNNPVLLLKRIRNWLNSGGIVVATVPNAKAFHKKIGKSMGIIKDLYELTKEDFKKGHKRIYDRNLLERDFKESGFKILESGGVFFKPFPHRQMERLDPKIFDALYEIGKELPDYCSSVYVCASKV